MRYALVIIAVFVLFLFGCAVDVENKVLFENISINEISTAENEHQLSFSLNNQAQDPAKCIVYLDLVGNVTSYDAGISESNSIKPLNISFTMPNGTADISFTHNCSFSSN